MVEARRVVLDTNTVLSALLFVNGSLVPLRTAWQSGEVTPLLCAQTVVELLRVLACVFRRSRATLPIYVGPAFRSMPGRCEAVVGLSLMQVVSSTAFGS